MAKKQKTNKRPKGPNVFGVLKPYKSLITWMIVVTLLANAVNLLIPQIIAKTIDQFSNGNFQLQTVITQFSIASLIIFTFTFLQGILQTYASEKVAKDLRSRLTHKISLQSYAFIQQSNPSKLLTNLTADVDSIKVFVSMAVASLFSSVFIIIATSILLLSIDWKLALNVLVVIPVIIGAFGMVFSKLGILFRQSREMVDKLNKIITESIIGAALVRVVNAQMTEYHKFMEANTTARNISLSILRLFATLIPIVVFVSNMATLAILFLGGHFVITGSMSLGDFAAFNSYLVILIFPIMIIGFISNFISQASASYGRIMEVLNAPDTQEEGTIKQELKGNIELKDICVNFGQKPVLKAINLQIEAGTRTAIIGPTAAGKTQLLYLLTGLLKPDSGSILFDQVPLYDYQKESFQHQVGFVFQDSVIFNLSLRENIAFNEQVNDLQLQKAIDTAQLTDFINSLPEGLNTVVSERGNSLSGGQKQRIMLARALALNPRILLLDDFTARVDSLTEQKILDNIRMNYPNITLISVTQKIASVQDYDQIILLEEGEMLAWGTHEILLKSSTEYVQIFNSQRSTNQMEEISIA